MPELERERWGGSEDARERTVWSCCWRGGSIWCGRLDPDDVPIKLKMSCKEKGIITFKLKKKQRRNLSDTHNLSDVK